MKNHKSTLHFILFLVFSNSFVFAQSDPIFQTPTYTPQPTFTPTITPTPTSATDTVDQQEPSFLQIEILPEDQTKKSILPSLFELKSAPNNDNTVHVMDNPASTALWHFDDNYADSSSNGHNLTAHGSPSFVTGKFGNAIAFGSDNDGALASDSDDWHFGSGDFTIDFWFKKSTPGNCGTNSGIWLSQAVVDQNNYPSTWWNGGNSSFTFMTWEGASPHYSYRL